MSTIQDFLEEAELMEMTDQKEIDEYVRKRQREAEEEARRNKEHEEKMAEYERERKALVEEAADYERAWNERVRRFELVKARYEAEGRSTTELIQFMGMESYVSCSDVSLCSDDSESFHCDTSSE